jgi:hypothetical protein
MNPRYRLERHPRSLNVKQRPSRMSSGGLLGTMGPGGGFVVAGAGFEAVVEDADERVGQLAQCGVVFDVAGLELVVVGAGAGGGVECAEGLGGEASMSRSLCTCRARTTFFLPEARVIGLVPA